MLPVTPTTTRAPASTPRVRSRSFMAVAPVPGSSRLRSYTMRSPFSVSQGSIRSITVVSPAITSASPPVPMTRMPGPSSARNRSTMPSTRAT